MIWCICNLYSMSTYIPHLKMFSKNIQKGNLPPRYTSTVFGTTFIIVDCYIRHNSADSVRSSRPSRPSCDSTEDCRMLIVNAFCI